MPRAKAAQSPAKKGKKVKKVKDKNAPKKPTTGFFFFVKHRRDMKADQGLKVSEFTKECGALWRNLGTAEKAKFDKLAAGDKERYQKEMAAYNPGSVKDPNEPDKPKKAATAFLLFANATRKKLQDEGFNQKEVLQEAGRLWKDMDDEDKAEYVEQAEVEKKKYNKAMEAYNQQMKGMKKNGAVGKSKAKAEESDEEEDDDEEDEDVDSDDE